MEVSIANNNLKIPTQYKLTEIIIGHGGHGGGNDALQAAAVAAAQAAASSGHYH